MKLMLRQHELPEFTVIRTSFQTGGKGQGENKWESQKSKNLLFSILLRPEHIPVEEQFTLSQMISLAIIEVLISYTSKKTEPQKFKIKWPNDIYFEDKKLGGILIENSLMKGKMATSIIGIGLNINQQKFISDAPNPVSLSEIMGKPCRKVNMLNFIFEKLQEIYQQNDAAAIQRQYISHLYRFDEWHDYQAGEEIFRAKITGVMPDGKLMLELVSGEMRGYYFKEVGFVVKN
jgi:BirA family biotin operon repressor/biotin-[acetyl-CoA-carboxylase] ligase